MKKKRSNKKKISSKKKKRSQKPSGETSEFEAGGSNIFVAVRVRPLNDKERYISDFETVKVLNENFVVLLDPQYEMAPEDV